MPSPREALSGYVALLGNRKTEIRPLLAGGGNLQPEQKMRTKELKIYPSAAQAKSDLPKCPRPKGGQLGHWWYIDSERLRKSPDFIPCVCGTCGQKMNLSIDSDPSEWPAV